ncbi:ATP-binding protein [Chelativorans xinjiangense]|uniref:ATP-binding protein n=1 Tax=Chelativorans xinjiangense TaxID=2681485 RepID=UPI0013590706|nr:ATP-binding protein [Chelativorans xinjiangense]
MMPVRATKFAEIRPVQQVRAAVKMASDLRFPVLVVGDAGFGKTTALKRVAQETGEAYCEVSQQTKSVKGMYRMLLDAYRIPPVSHFTYELADQCLRWLDNANGSIPPVLVDEYQNFEPKTLRELLRVHEHCRFALVLAGNRERLAASKKEAGALSQINSRIGMRVHIERPTSADCKSIGVEYNVEGKDTYAAIASYGARTSIRQLCFLLDMCVANSDGVGSIQIRHIETAVIGLHGRRDALKLLSPNT